MTTGQTGSNLQDAAKMLMPLPNGCQCRTIESLNLVVYTQRNMSGLFNVNIEIYKCKTASSLK